jgi:hypothetical protein
MCEELRVNKVKSLKFRVGKRKSRVSSKEGEKFEQFQTLMKRGASGWRLLACKV